MLSTNNQTESSLHINLMPMIDVILCLLIFFMAATKLYDWNEQELDVEVPKVGAAKPMTDAPADIVLNITSEGIVSIEDQAVSVTEIAIRLREAREKYPDRGVLIRGDGRVVYQKVAEVMSACETAGVKRIAVSVREALNKQISL